MGYYVSICSTKSEYGVSTNYFNNTQIRGRNSATVKSTYNLYLCTFMGICFREYTDYAIDSVRSVQAGISIHHDLEGRDP